jgi:hypothetical protein
MVVTDGGATVVDEYFTTSPLNLECGQVNSVQDQANDCTLWLPVALLVDVASTLPTVTTAHCRSGRCVGSKTYSASEAEDRAARLEQCRNADEGAV